MHPDTNPILIPDEDGASVAVAFSGATLRTFARSFLSFSCSWKPAFHSGDGAEAVALQTSSKFLNRSPSVVSHGNLEPSLSQLNLIYRLIMPDSWLIFVVWCFCMSLFAYVFCVASLALCDRWSEQRLVKLSAAGSLGDRVFFSFKWSVLVIVMFLTSLTEHHCDHCFPKGWESDGSLSNVEEAFSLLTWFWKKVTLLNNTLL